MENILQREAKRVVTQKEAEANFKLVTSGGLKASVWGSLVATALMMIIVWVTR
jgi:hypothetical protein